MFGSTTNSTDKAPFALLFFVAALLCFASTTAVRAQDPATEVVVDTAGSIISSIIPALIFGFWGITFLVLCGFVVLWVLLAVFVGIKYHKAMKEKGMDKEWTITFALWFFLGWTGAHRIFNSDNRGFIILVLYIISWLTAWFLVGGILCAGLLIFLTTELFRLPALTSSGIEKRGAKSDGSTPKSSDSTVAHEMAAHQGQQSASFIAPPPPATSAAQFYADQPVGGFAVQPVPQQQGYPYLQGQPQV